MDDQKKAKKATEKTVELGVEQKRIKELETQVGDANNDRLRALADFQNLQKRTRDDQERFVKLSTASLITQMLMPYGHLNTAAEQSKDKGLEMIARQFKQIFEQEGVKEIEAQGKKFDPHTMEAIEQVEGEKDMVIRVREPGYMLHEYVLKPARVEVGKGK